ncbi:hypothetical protein [Streptomyces sp. NPDC127105]|uniref:hypothetical protein n=1 Tax=Streptomyces sp. NPDC127105 TaxID=3345359 RepID=UPI00364B1E2E
MSSFLTVDLRGEADWDPGRLVGSTFAWPTAAPVVPLRELVTTVRAGSVATAGSPVITPAGLVARTGAIRRRSTKYQGKAFTVGTRGLRRGDVLVPPSPSGPAVLVDDRLNGALLSSRFTALRPLDPVFSRWIWAVLNSRAAQARRASLATGTTMASVKTPDLLEMGVPLPPLVEVQRLDRVLASIEVGTHREEEPSESTWWVTADLRRRVDWGIMLATPRPELLEDGEPLGSFVREMKPSRSTRSFEVPTELPGTLPVVDVSALGGRPTRRWAAPQFTTVTLIAPGDLLIARVGEYSYATVAQRPAVADPGIFVLRLHDQSQGPALAHFLNGREGQTRRRMFLRGVTVPSLRRTDIERFPIPAEALEFEGDVEPDVGLADQLEQVLWTA